MAAKNFSRNQRKRKYKQLYENSAEDSSDKENYYIQRKIKPQKT